MAVHHLLVIALAASQCCATLGGLASADWPQWGRRPTFQSFQNVGDEQVGLSVLREWTFKADDRVVGSPAVALGRVWFGSDDGHLYCLNATTGEQLWSYLVTSPDKNCTGNYCEHGLCQCAKIRSSPAVLDDGSVYFGSYDFNIYKLDISGKLVWKVKTGGAVYGPVTIDTDGTAFVGSFDGLLYAISSSGNVSWKFDLQSHGDVGWAIGEGDFQHLIVGQSNEGGMCTSWPPPDVPNWPHPTPGGGHCFVYAVDKRTGALVWKYHTGAPGGGGLIVGNKYINANWNQNVTAFHMRTGKVMWQFQTNGSLESHPAYHDGIVFASAEESKALFAINVTNGEMLWKYTGASEELNSSPSISRDTVFVGSNDHYLHAVDRLTGKLKFKFKTCANVFSSAAIADSGMVFVGCNTETGPVASGGVGAMYAINPSIHKTSLTDFIV